MRPIAPLSSEDRAVVRRIIERTQAEPVPTIAAGRLQEITLRYELRLQEAERTIEELSIQNGAKAVALDEMRERVQTGKW